jgi:DNA end-binding protein Ku
MFASTPVLIELIGKARTIAEKDQRRTVVYLLGLAADMAADEKRLQGAEPLEEVQPETAPKMRVKKPAKRVEGQREMLLPIAGNKAEEAHAESAAAPSAHAARKKAG